MDETKGKDKESYRIIDHLYDTQKDFIILGLCGKVGSGISTVANLLEKRFEDLRLPAPGFADPDLNAAHEYRILYTYAKKNWKPFHKIRTSALITRHVLSEGEDRFIDFLNELYRSDKFKNIVKAFFEEQMECDLQEYYTEMCLDPANGDAMPTDVGKLKEPWRILLERGIPEYFEPVKSEENPEERQKNKKIKISLDLQEQEDPPITFEYDCDKKVCRFSNTQLSRLFDIYQDLRRVKSGFQNPCWDKLLKQYIYEFLPKISSKLWSAVREESKSLPTQALQYLGNSLRLFKTPYMKEWDQLEGDRREIKEDGYTCLAEDINIAIKVLRSYQLKLRERYFKDDIQIYSPGKLSEEIRTIVAVDSIKNLYESMYLKQRYSNYFLVGIYTEDHERKKRLREIQHLADDDIEAMDIIEQNSVFKKKIKEYERWKEQKTQKNQKCPVPAIIEKMYEQFEKHNLLGSLSYISPFIMQNVASCLDSPDILINNRTDNRSYFYLKKNLLRYVSLIMNPALVLPTPVERCMQVAYTAKLNSGCISRQVGAVLTDSGYHLLSIGWNQQPEGQLPCSYRDLCELYYHESPEGYSDFENDDNDDLQQKIKGQMEGLFDRKESPFREKGKLPCYCFKDYYNSIQNQRNQVHTRALHAEETAFLNLGPNNERVKNGILFTTSSPCELCSKKAMFLGISKIYYVEPYAGVSYKHVMGIGSEEKRPQLILFTGAIGTAYTKLYTPLLPRKDENEMWLGAKMGVDLMETLGLQDRGGL